MARVSSLVALACAATVVTLLVLGGGEGHSYRLLFENAGQLVPGNQVRIGGHVVGGVDSVDLSDDYQAEVEITVDEPLHEGTTAVVRLASLSGVANRYVSLTPGPSDDPELPDGAVMDGRLTTSAVDLDQLFNSFTPRTRQALRNVIQGQAAVYAGRGPQANQTYRYFGPALQSTTRLLAELSRDQQTLADFLIEGARVTTAVGERRAELASLIGNANEALAAVASENSALDRTLVALPPAMRQANTTFVNLRGALDDLGPLIETAKPATAELTPFLAQLRPVAEAGIPVFGDLARALDRAGEANDLSDALRDAPGLRTALADATPSILTALDDAQPTIAFARPYAPDLLGFATKFGQISAYYDANGHYARVQSANLDLFEVDSAAAELQPIPPEEQFSGLDFDQFRRCPGGATQPLAGSNPFTDGGALLAGGQPPNPKCDPSDVPPGP
jgi:phospholipid/cholesterol/gamma-HCH transport system substrate-binding protein